MALKCDHCDSLFINKSTLNRHLRNRHQLQFGNLENKLCPICSKRGNKRDIINHFKSDHGISLNVTYKLFQDLNDFYEWKKKVEEETVSSFVKVRQSQVLKDGSRVLYFHCHRDGIFIPSGSKKRNIKILGSNKINAFCPSQISVRVDSSCVSVKFIETHVGHAKEFSRINYYKKNKRNIEDTKFSPDDLTDNTENPATKTPNEIGLCQNLNCTETGQNSISMKHLNYYESIQSWIEEMKSNNYSTVRFYKPKGVIYECLQKEDVILIYFTDIQIELLRLYGNNCICVDGTHGLSKRVTQMFTLLVIDNTRQSIPCAFMITNRTDSTVFKIFFETVKASLECELNPQVFMSDVNKIVYNGWQMIMPPADKYLYSWWYVDREWQANLKKRVPVIKHSEVYKKLRILLEESNELDFREKLRETLLFLRTDPDTESFAEYFTEVYDKNIEAWAYCFRLYAGLSININLEKMHRNIKYLYLKGKNLRRIDDAINNIILFFKTRIFDSLKLMEKENALSINKNTEKLHEITFGMEKNVSSVMKTGDEWVISCYDSSSYKVQKVKDDCFCKTKCPLCNICIHSSSCSCVENSIYWNVCSHMHYICTSFKGMDNTDFSATFGERDYFEIAMPPSAAYFGGSDENVTDILACKEQAKEKLLSIMEIVNKSNSLDEIRTILNLVDHISSELHSQKEQEPVTVN